MHTTQFSSQQNLKEAASVNPPPPSKAPTVLLDAISAYTDKKKKPKRNRSAFILFSIDIRKKTQQENLDILNPNDKFVKIAQLWKELSDEERKVYEERAREEKERYASELSSFCKSFPSEPIQRPRNHIKKPCNAYGYYLKDVKEAIRKESPELRMCEVLRIVGERWKKLSSEDRQKYEKKAEVSRKKFKAEITKQNNANKKANVLKRETTASKGKDDQTSDTKGLDDDNLLRMDPIVLKNERAEKKETQGLYEPPIQKMQKLEQENIRPNTQQQRQPLMPTPRNTNMLDDLNSNLSLLLGNDAFSEAFTHDTDESSASSNTMTLQALQNLLGKVENLRHHILIQMHLVSNKEQSLLFPSNLDYFTLLELAQNATPDFRVIPGLQSGGQEYRKREF